MKPLLRSLLICAMLNVDAEAARADGPGLCVQPVASRAPVDGAAARPAGTIVSRRSQAIAPSYLRLPVGANLPLIYDSFTEKLPDATLQNRAFFWRLSSAGELIGPYEGAEADGNQGRIAADAEGRVVFLAGSYESIGTERMWRQQIYIQDSEQLPFLFGADGLAEIGEPRAIFWSDLQQALLIGGMGPDPGTGGTAFESFLVKGSEIELLDGYDLDLTSDLPSFGVTALLGSHGLRFLDRQGASTLLGHIKRALDGDNWIGIYETADAGWIYIDGETYDHAVRVAQSDGVWHIVYVIRFVNDQDAYNHDNDPARMQLEGVSKVILTGRCRGFSVVLRRMIVCGDQPRELRDGSLAPIGSGKEGLALYLGDAAHLGLALFRGDDGTLYGYDGDRLHPVPGALPELVRVQDLPASKRTLLSTPTALLELRRNGQELQLEELDVPLPHGDVFFTRFFDLGGSVVALLREGAYSVDGRGLRPIWLSRDGGQIDTTSHLAPEFVPLLSGVLFVSRVGVSGIPQFQLLKDCAGPG